MVSLRVTASAVNTKIETATQEEQLNISKKLSIKQLFLTLSDKTDYEFFYSDNLKGLTTQVTIDVTDASVKEILQLAFDKQALEYTITGKDILVRNKATTTTVTKETIVKAKQVATVSGTVFDDYDMPLPGVNVLIQGTQQGTVTDFDGNFSIEANPKDVLLFSYMGFEDKTVIVGAKTSFIIKMLPSANQLDEVIISGVAAGTSKKKMSVSVAKIKSDDIGMAPQSSVSSSLSGKMAGVNITSLNGSPGSGSSITLRGATSLTGNQAPMILMDGVIMQGSLADINVDDVESIEVVKGAAASALYGSKAGNGVVVVTSKRGSKLKEDQTSYTFRTRFEMQQVAKYLDLSESHPYELSPDWLEATTYTMYNDVDYPEDYVSGWNPNISGNRHIKYDGYMDLPYRVNNDLQKSMFTNGLSYTNYFGVGHKTEKMNVFGSFESNADKGIVIETGGYKRKSLRGNVDYNFTDNIKFSASNNFIMTSNNFMGGGTGSFFDVLMMEPDVDLFAENADGQKYNYFPNHWNTIVTNPLYDLWKKESRSAKTRFLGSYKLKWRLTDWVSADASYAIERQHYHSYLNTPDGSFVGMQTSSDTDSPIQTQRITSDYNSYINNKNLRGTLNFNQMWDELDFKGKLSYLYEDNDFNSRSTIYDDHLEEIKAVNYFAIASFVYKDRYIFDGLYRYDGSSLFGANERWQSYYRLSGAYRLTQDVEIPGVQELKLRTAYGTSGQRPSFAAQYETMSENNGILAKETLGNVDLKPSLSTELEVGLDVSFLSRFTFEATYSNTLTEDQFIKTPLAAPMGGFKYQWANVGSLESNTIEALLRGALIKTDDMKWNLGVTFDRTRSKITQLDIPAYSTGPRGAFRIEDGGEYGVMYGVDFVHTLDEMEAQLPEGANLSDYTVNADGLVVLESAIGTNDEAAIHLLDADGTQKKVVIGNINANFRMGANTTFSYKNFSFYMLWKWKNGGDIYNGTAQYLVRDLRHAMMDQRFTPTEEKKTVAYYQSLYDAQQLNGFWVEDASYIRLNEASIYYTLSPKNASINSLKMGLIGKNLVTITDYTGYDPEAGYSGFIFDNYGYPNFRNYALSVEVKF